MRRRVDRFLSEPPTVRRAAAVVVSVTFLVVVIGALAMRILDSREFPNIGRSLWWSLQTATTVGYGDVTPKSLIGRLVAAAVMLEGIAFVAIVTAVITSTFVERAMKERRGAGTASWDALEGRLAELAERFEQVEESMRRHVGETPPERFTPIERGPGRDQPVR